MCGLGLRLTDMRVETYSACTKMATLGMAEMSQRTGLDGAVQESGKRVS
jgi:hypothetical protein